MIKKIIIHTFIILLLIVSLVLLPYNIGIHSVNAELSLICSLFWGWFIGVVILVGIFVIGCAILFIIFYVIKFYLWSVDNVYIIYEKIKIYINIRKEK